MKYILLLLIALHLPLFSAQKSKPITKAYIEFAENLHVELNSSGFNSSHGVIIFASFSLKNEYFRSIKLTRKSISYPLHEIVLARKDYTIYILDLQKQQMIGQFSLPSRATPRFIKVEPNDEKTTNLRYHFRILPKKGTKGRPGPLIEKILSYKNGKYKLLTREDIKNSKEKMKPHGYYKKKIINEAKKSEESVKEYFYELVKVLKQNAQTKDDEHDKYILEAVQQNQKDWYLYKYSYCQSKALIEVYPSTSRLHVQILNKCLTQHNKERMDYLENLMLEITELAYH